MESEPGRHAAWLQHSILRLLHLEACAFARLSLDQLRDSHDRMVAQMPGGCPDWRTPVGFRNASGSELLELLLDFLAAFQMREG